MLDKITGILEELRTTIILNMDTYPAKKGENATYNTQKSLQVVKYDGGVKLVSMAGDNAPLVTLEKGLEPMWVPINPLKMWAAAKFNLEDEREINSIAYAVQHKIAKKGTDRFTTNYDAYSTAVNEAVEKIKGSIHASVAEAISTNF